MSINDVSLGDYSLISGSNYDATNISYFDVFAFIGSNPTYVGLKGLCLNTNINTYAAFKPNRYENYIPYHGMQYDPGLDEIVYAKPTDATGYRLGDFAGYNHNAPPPTKSYYNTKAVYPVGGGDATVAVLLTLGEIDWRTTVLTNIVSVKMKIAGFGISDSMTLEYTDARQTNGFEFSKGVYVDSNVSLTVSFVFITNTDTEIAIPEVVSHTVYVSQATTDAIFGFVTLSADLQDTYPDGELAYNDVTSELKTHNDTFTFYGLCIDETGDGEGDVSVFGVALYAMKNADGKWYAATGSFDLPSGGVNIIDEELPFAISGGDVVDFELRKL